MVTLGSKDFQGICRICLHSPDPPRSTLVKVSPGLFEDLFGVDKKDNDEDTKLLPAKICNTCQEKCQKWKCFRKVFHANQIILRAIIDREANTSMEDDDDDLNTSLNEEIIEEVVPSETKRFKPEEDIEISTAVDELEEEVTEEQQEGENKWEIESVFYAESETEQTEDPPRHDLYTVEVVEQPKTRSPRSKPKSKLKPTPKDPNFTLPERYQLFCIECFLCEAEFPNCVEYNKHIVENHPVTEELIFCTKCPSTDSQICKDSFLSHSYIHSKIRFMCPIPGCSTRLLTRTTLLSHLIFFHSEDVKIKFRQCGICSAFSDGEKELKQHMLSHFHPGANTCLICGLNFESPTLMSAHFYGHFYNNRKSFCCEECGRLLKSPEAYENHKKTHMKRIPVTCDICGKRYASADYMQKHRVIHSMEKTVQCPECTKLFYTEKHLKAHIKTHGENNRSYICEHCNRGFFNSGVLKEHIRAAHTGERQYPCEECGRSYFRRRELVEHQRSHTGEKPFTCEVCNRIYARKTTLMTHMKTHRSK